MISGLFDWMVVFNWAILVILLTLLVLIRIALSVFRLVFLLRLGVEVFWWFGPKVRSLVCDVLFVFVLSMRLLSCVGSTCLVV